MVTLQTAENALKTVYLGTISDIINLKTNPLLSLIEQTEADVYGKEIHTACKVGLNGGFGAGTEDGSLPHTRSNKYIKFISTLKNLYGKIEISDKAIRAGSDERGSFTDILNEEIESLINASKFNLGRMLYGDGTGNLGTIRYGGNLTYSVSDVRNLAPGMVVDFALNGSIVKPNVRIDSVNYENNYVKISETDEIPEEATMYVQGSKDNEITGLGALFGSSEYLYGNKRSEIAEVLPIKTNLDRTIDDVVIQRMIDRIETTSNATVNFIGVSSDVKYEYQEYLTNYRRNIDIMNLAGGFKSLSYNGIPVVYDRFIEPKAMYLLDTTQFKLHRLCDWRFLESINGKILHQREDRPVYTATLVKYCDLICSNPKGQGKIENIRKAS